MTIADRFALSYLPAAHRRLIAGKEVIIHCHHYNARLQRTIEGVKEIDGKEIIRSSAEAVFAEQIATALRDGDDEVTRWEVARQLYIHLGYGSFDTSAVADGVVTASHSHFVEGWRAGFERSEHRVCSLTEGYLQAAVFAATGELVDVREEACMNSGAERCRFVIDRSRTAPLARFERSAFAFTPKLETSHENPSNIDEPAVISAIVGMPIHGDAEGLIPAFGVYLANTPADFYNLICIRFVEEMQRNNMFATAKRLLVSAGETCAMNTFRGIMASPEWDGLVAPMVKQEQDKLYGLVALSNGFGWGNWRIVEHEPEQSMRLESLNGYEAYGFRELRGTAEEAQCFMLAGVAAGMMELIYAQGTVAERFGTYLSAEESCICKHHGACEFAVEAA